MPCIIIRTNVEIPSDRAKELKTALAVSWEKVPTKRERWLMIVMEDKQQMFFSGRDTPAAFVNFKIHRSLLQISFERSVDAGLQTVLG